MTEELERSRTISLTFFTIAEIFWAGTIIASQPPPGIAWLAMASLAILNLVAMGISDVSSFRRFENFMPLIASDMMVAIICLLRGVYLLAGKAGLVFCAGVFTALLFVDLLLQACTESKYNSYEG